MNPSRRDFLKYTAVGGAAAAVFGFDLQPAYAQLRTLKIARASETRSTCPYCAVGCGTIIYTIGDRAKNVTAQVVHVEGDPVGLSPGRDLAAYRILQEALTNAVRHSRSQRAEVTLQYLPTELRLEVADGGLGAIGQFLMRGHRGSPFCRSPRRGRRRLRACAGG